MTRLDHSIPPALLSAWSGLVPRGDAPALPCPLPGRRGDGPTGERLGGAPPIETLMSRAIEIAAALMVLMLAAPLLAAAALTTRLQGSGPVLEPRIRIGQSGRPFTLWRFRLPETGLGRALGRARVQDLPQFLNVLRGEMALVGPRPEAPASAIARTRWIPAWRSREAVRPGITGLAQLHQAVTNLDAGGSLAEARRMLAYDLDYIRRRSLRLDIVILLATARTVLTQEATR